MKAFDFATNLQRGIYGYDQNQYQILFEKNLWDDGKYDINARERQVIAVDLAN
jgi:hypothetical protein